MVSASGKLQRDLFLHPDWVATRICAGGEFASANCSYMGYATATPFIAKGVYSYGYGDLATMNLGRNFEGAAAMVAGGIPACAAQTKDIRQVTAGFWHNFYDGPAGKIRVGAIFLYGQGLVHGRERRV